MVTCPNAFPYSKDAQRQQGVLMSSRDFEWESSVNGGSSLVKMQPLWWGILISGKAIYMWEQKVYENSPHLQLNFALNMNFFFFFCLFRAASVAYGGSQARSWIGATASGYTTATAKHDPSWVCNPHRSSQQCQILNPLSEARDRTWVLMDTS